jgi:hypothetical protein
MFPYDSPHNTDSSSKDWTYVAARGVLADLCDRKGIKDPFQLVDEYVRKDIVDTLACIIRIAENEKNV